MEGNMNQEVQVDIESSAQVSENSLNEVDNNVETEFTETDSKVKTTFDDGGDGEGGEGADNGGEDAAAEGADGADPEGAEPEGEDPTDPETNTEADPADNGNEGDGEEVSDGEDEGDKPDPATEDEEGISSKIKELEDNYSLLEQNYNELQSKFTTLQEENAELLAYKNNIESQKKKELINSFYMLTDEDKKDVNENINKYSYDEIESKLAVICCRKKVSFDKNDTEEVNNNVLTYNLNHVDSNNDLPAWLKAVEETKQKNI